MEHMEGHAPELGIGKRNKTIGLPLATVGMVTFHGEDKTPTSGGAEETPLILFKYLGPSCKSWAASMDTNVPADPPDRLHFTFAIMNVALTGN